jgi:hypothetical protein
LSGGRFPFSTGTIVTSAVTNAIPLVLGFGNSRVYTIGTPDFTGESTIPQEISQYAIPIPFNGTLHDFEIGGDIFVSAAMGGTGLVYQLQVLRGALPASGTGSANDGNAFSIGADPPPNYYLLTGFEGTLTYPATFTPPVNLMATNLISGPLIVNAGDRIAVRLIVQSGSAADIGLVTRLGFHASLSYSPS